VDVSPEGIAASCDGVAFTPVVHAEKQKVVEKWWRIQHPPLNPNPPPVLASRSKLGLFILKAEAAFRNVVISPAQPNPLNPKED
jgi:hypothetical protein